MCSVVNAHRTQSPEYGARVSGFLLYYYVQYVVKSITEDFEPTVPRVCEKRDQRMHFHILFKNCQFFLSSQAPSFRSFWGEKSELRRFKDGSILEAVVWPCNSLAERRTVCGRIIKHLLQR